MKKDLTEIVFLLDRSGSMSMLVDDTLGGYNGFLRNQLEVKGDARITTVLFDDRIELLHNGTDIRQVKPLTTQQYYTRGTTSLLDAVGNTISDVGRRLNQTVESERPEKVIFVITTDGYENSSCEYSFEQIRTMIVRQKNEYNWNFIFLGADVEAEEIAGSIGIASEFSAKYSATSQGTTAMFACMNESIEEIRLNGKMTAEWKEGLDIR